MRAFGALADPTSAVCAACIPPPPTPCAGGCSNGCRRVRPASQHVHQQDSGRAAPPGPHRLQLCQVRGIGHRVGRLPLRCAHGGWGGGGGGAAPGDYSRHSTRPVLYACVAPAPVCVRASARWRAPPLHDLSGLSGCGCASQQTSPAATNLACVVAFFVHCRPRVPAGQT